MYGLYKSFRDLKQKYLTSGFCYTDFGFSLLEALISEWLKKINV